jgi:hypothetical protein
MPLMSKTVGGPIALSAAGGAAIAASRPAAHPVLARVRGQLPVADVGDLPRQPDDHDEGVGLDHAVGALGAGVGDAGGQRGEDLGPPGRDGGGQPFDLRRPDAAAFS